MSGNRRALWLVPLALLVTGVLALLGTWSSAGGIETDLTERARAALASAGLRADVTFDGRDATLHGVAADRQRAADVVASVDGVRTVRDEGPEAEEAGEDGTHGAANLQATIGQALKGNPITFRPNTSVLTRQGEQALSTVLDAIRSAGDEARTYDYEVSGYAAKVAGGDPRESARLSAARADTVARKLVDAGVSDEKVTTVGKGDAPSRGENGDPAKDRRAEITVR
ncbi:OmpA family protein [Saccharomonospora sp. NPDC006951]